MTKLSVNINKLATLRNSRGGNLPDVAVAAARILNWGAHGITVHPRPDGRHIRSADVTAVNAVVRERNVTDKAKKEFNVEGYPSTAYLTGFLRSRGIAATQEDLSLIHISEPTRPY